jgi:hypothetical protein
MEVETSFNHLVDILAEISENTIEPIYLAERTGEVKLFSLSVTKCLAGLNSWL